MFPGDADGPGTSLREPLHDSILFSVCGGGGRKWGERGMGARSWDIVEGQGDSEL